MMSVSAWEEILRAVIVMRTHWIWCERRPALSFCGVGRRFCFCARLCVCVLVPVACWLRGGRGGAPVATVARLVGVSADVARAC